QAAPSQRPPAECCMPTSSRRTFAQVCLKKLGAALLSWIFVRRSMMREIVVFPHEVSRHRPRLYVQTPHQASAAPRVQGSHRLRYEGVATNRGTGKAWYRNRGQLAGCQVDAGRCLDYFNTTGHPCCLWASGN